MTFFLRVIGATALTLCMSMAASAQIVVGGTGAAHSCYQAAKFGNQGSLKTIRECKEALSEFHLSQKDTAATHVNIGVLYMRRGENENAPYHYKKAIDLRPKMAEIYINYGASVIHMGNYNEAVTAINKAIDLETVKMPEALYNRAIAYNRLENYKGAYKDLKQALVLKPEWPAAIQALENYTVTRAPKSN